MKIIHFDVIDSTNEYVKAHKGEGDMIVTATEQTAGKGSKGRSFLSQKGGVYLTKYNEYTDFPPSKAFHIMIDSSVAVCKTVQDLSLTPTIKWPNDVFVNGKKICGILIENTFASSTISSSVVGIGVNVNNALSEELLPFATTLQCEAKKPLDVEEVKNRLVEHLTKSYSVEEYKKYIPFFGKKILLLQEGKKSVVTALDVDETGRLIVQDGDRVYPVSAGEVSLRTVEE